MLVEEGYAFAYSTHGELDYCVKAGTIHTHQLTEWVIDNYDVSNEVFLYGLSFGGNVALLLAEKYPNLYDGVLDIVGIKDLKEQWNYDHSPDFVTECGGTPEEKPKAYERRSPTYNTNIRVPVISAYGGLDITVLPEQHEAYASALEAAGVAEDYYRSYEYPDFDHSSWIDQVIKENVILPHFMDLVDWVVDGIEPPDTLYFP